MAKKSGKSPSLPDDLAEYAEIVEEELRALPKKDRRVARRILRHLASGDESALRNLCEIDFKSEPVDIEQFIDDKEYLGAILREGNKSLLYPAWREELLDLFSPDRHYQEWVIGGSIGTGKTSAAAIVITYLVYRLSRLRQPHVFFSLAPTMLVVFGIYSVTKTLSADAAMGKIRYNLENIPYFRHKFPVVERIKRVISFEKNRRIQILAGSKVFHTLSLDLFAFLLDEGNFFTQSAKSEGLGDMDGSISEAYDIHHNAITRIRSRFMETGGLYPGIAILISSKRSRTAFLEQHIKASTERIAKGEVKVTEFAIWDVKPKKLFTLPKFQVEVGDETQPSRIIESITLAKNPAKVIDVPGEFRHDFETNIELALRDLAGVSTTDVSAFLRDPSLLQEAITPGLKHPFFRPVVRLDFRGGPNLEDFFDADALFSVRHSRRIPIHHPRAYRFVHIDLALTNDSAGLVIGHVGGLRKIKRMREDGSHYIDSSPEVWIDLALRIMPPGFGGEIGIGKIRQFVVNLRDWGLPIAMVSADGFQSAQTLQELSTCVPPFNVHRYSVDRTDDAYCALRQIVTEKRLRCYFYEPLFTEISNLQHDLNARKVDHPKRNPDGTKGSKDVSDGLAAVCLSCIAAPNLRALSLPPEALDNDEGKPLEYRMDIGPDLIRALDHEYLRRLKKPR